MSRAWLWAVWVGVVVAFMAATVARSILVTQGRRRRVRARYAVLGAYMAGNKLATSIARALEMRVEGVYAALAELETRGWLTSELQLPKPADNHSPAPTAAKGAGWYPNIEDDTRRGAEGEE